MAGDFSAYASSGFGKVHPCYPALERSLAMGGRAGRLAVDPQAQIKCVWDALRRRMTRPRQVWAAVDGVASLGVGPKILAAVALRAEN